MFIGKIQWPGKPASDCWVEITWSVSKQAPPRERHRRSLFIFFAFFRCVELRNITSTAATLCFQPLLRPCDSSSAVGRVEEKGNYSPLFHFLWCPLEKLCSVWKAPAETQPAGAQHTVGFIFIFFSCRVVHWDAGFFFCCVAGVCLSNVRTENIQSACRPDGDNRWPPVAAQVDAGGATESYWSHWLVQP